MTDKLKMQELTSQEARDHLTENAVILLPMGSLEDQGVHAPMGDYLGAEAVALEIARAARSQGVSTFVAPVIPFGGKDYFDSSHGGISLRQSTLTALLDDMIDSLVQHGLRKILIVNGHGGNVPAITEVTARWRRTEGIFIPSMYLWQIAYELLKEILGPEAAAKSSGHGGDPLTSIGLHHYPDILRPDLMRSPATSGTVKGMEIGGFGGNPLRRREGSGTGAGSRNRAGRNLDGRSTVQHRRNRAATHRATLRDRSRIDPRPHRDRISGVG